MSLPRIATREEWVAASEALLAEEKELTRRRDGLNARRREMPMVEVTEDYTFDGPDGPARLLDMFEGRRQLIVYHFMFDPSWDDGCPSCTAGTDELSPGFFEHLHVRDTSYALVSRAWRCSKKPADSSSVPAVQLGQPSSQLGSNMKWTTMSWRRPSNRSSSVASPSGPVNR